ncbi:sam dependent methyltransferase [Gordonia sp. (in: high G+C Gram-positive bacteria)]|uniref:sam dependent methyltransferase n=1 Tax=Gordonia sp. (in: high G+C Gram-positive bacteria) TaxID=84139 RepID=UPI003C709340
MAALTELVCGDLMRSVMIPEAPGIRVHEILARTMLESVTGDRSHRYSFATSTLQRLGGELQVKMNAAGVLRREVHRRSWRRETVAFGTVDDPYQPVEERYRLMPQVLAVLAESQTPIALFTSSPLLSRDLPLLRLIARSVPVTVSIAVPTLDPALSSRLEPGASTPQARVALVEGLASAGLAPHVRIAPLAPLLADGTSQLSELLSALADAGAARVSVSPLQLDGDLGTEFLDWLGVEHPALVRRYRSLYGKRSFVSAEYSMKLRSRMGPLVERYGLGGDAVSDLPPTLAPAARLPRDDFSTTSALTLF